MGSCFQKYGKFSNLVSKSTAVCEGAFSEADDKWNCDYSMRLCFKRLVNIGVLPQASILMLDNLLTLCFGQLFSERNRSILKRCFKSNSINTKLLWWWKFCKRPHKNSECTWTAVHSTITGKLYFLAYR